jgi:hypothetical protein
MIYFGIYMTISPLIPPLNLVFAVRRKLLNPVHIFQMFSAFNSLPKRHASAFRAVGGLAWIATTVQLPSMQRLTPKSDKMAVPSKTR